MINLRQRKEYERDWLVSEATRAHEYLDKLNIPIHDNWQKYSLVGRIQQLIKKYKTSK